jgi:uncharacterized protein (DUF2336 family)
MTLAPSPTDDILLPEDEQARVRLGASTTTPPDVLRRLAADRQVTVRAAVAINRSAPADAVDSLARDADERVRALIARKLAALVPSLDAVAQARLHQHALATLTTLVADETQRVRAAIASVLAEMPGAPRALVLRLAADADFTVGEPVIRLSPLLTPDDLIALIAAPPNPQAATAVARRPDLAPAVSDAIAASADAAAIRALLCNRTAAIQEATLDALVARAADQPDWHEPLVRRPALPARAAAALSEIVATHLLEVLAARPDLDPALIGDMRRRIAARLAEAGAPRPAPSTSAPPTLSTEAAMHEAERMAREGRLTEAALQEALRRGDERLAAAMLAVAADMPLCAVGRAASLRSAKAVVSLVWQAGFSMRIAGPLQSRITGLPPGAILLPGPAGSFPLAVEEMRWQIDILRKLVVRI